MKKSRGHYTGKKLSRSPLGVFLWLGLFIFISTLIVTLFILFPDQELSEDTYLDIIRLFGIMVLVSSGLMYIKKIKFVEVVRNASIWIGIVSILFLGYSYRTELSGVMSRVGGELIPGLAVTLSPNEIIITASQNGHFYVNGRANGKQLRFLVDTGASNVMLSPKAASRIGIDLGNLQFTERYKTANGIGLGAPYWLERFSIGPFQFVEMKVSINQAELSHSLLGMSFLDQFQSFEFRGDKLYLRK